MCCDCFVAGVVLDGGETGREVQIGGTPVGGDLGGH